MTTHRHNKALIERLQASWSDPDPNTFVSLFTDDGIFEDRTYGIRVQGKDALLAHSRRIKKHVVDMTIDILTHDATEEAGFAEWRLSHDFVGNFDGVDCTGKPIVIQGASVYRFERGCIARATDYWNYMEIIRCVGVLPRELRDYRTS